ncbi:HutD/Ves family protein [Trinickia dinghuensis]|uniref:HutD family protein n=1 Tax=Trinickia dinghuensis TaxID=2291023 RepID=A0A3D8K5D6_9BURK|nr:HutD family protein [Trinickia dinghuensis]RDV00243.1 hypothetical protein DWV00_00020 [Trinickia dinghuensis]
MSAIDIRPLSSVPAEPWRNGGGITRTLATNGKAWRVSVAQVERDGPYSRFEGITRVSFVLRGRGVTLRAAEPRSSAVVALEPFEAVEYDGGIEWDASLVDGPVTALNVMSAAGRYRVTVDAIVVATIVPPGCAAIVVALDSELRYSYGEPGASGAGAGTVEAGQFMVVHSVDRPLRLEPNSRGAKPPIIVTIQSAAAGTTD